MRGGYNDLYIMVFNQLRTGIILPLPVVFNIIIMVSALFSLHVNEQELILIIINIKIIS
jgi:hypothetical protein